MSSESVASRLDTVLREIEAAASRSGRPANCVELVAISKKQPITLMEEYASAARARGLTVVFGENYIQELKKKRAEIVDDVIFHVTGPLQGNKVRDAVRHGDVIESVHSREILREIATEARKAGKRQPIFLQVNIALDGAKKGFSPDDIQAVLHEAAADTDALRLDGLMTITALYDEPEGARGDFRRMADLRSQLEQAGLASSFYESKIRLSMGMSADFQVAIEEGADLVRVGTALFGERAA